jgi:hypothetical protein
MFLSSFKRLISRDGPARRLFSNKNEELREDNDELGERRAEAFEAYEEKCEPMLNIVGKRACPPIAQCGTGFEANSFNNINPTVATTAKTTTKKSLFF